MTTRTLAAAVVTAAALATPPVAHGSVSYEDNVLAGNPLTYYRMGETAGTIAFDASANHRDGAYVDAALGAAGPFLDAGTAVTLAKGAKVTAAVESPSGSVELWVNPDRLRRGQEAGYIAHGDPAVDGWAVGIGAKRKLTFVSRGQYVTLRKTISANTWTMLVVTWSDTKLRVFVNGVLAKEIKRSGTAPASSNASVVIGDTAAGAFMGQFSGRFDEVALFDHVLSAEQVRSHFAASTLPVNTTAPQIGGIPMVGETLTAVPGTWTGATTAPSYQWQACDDLGDDCEDIVGATAGTYVVALENAGGTLQVLETVGNAAGSISALSDVTGVVAPLPVVVDPGTGTGDTGSGTGDAGTSTPTGDTGAGTIVESGTSGATSPDAGTAAVLGSSAQGSCLRLVSSKRKFKLRRLGLLRLKTARNGCIRISAPVRAAFKVAKGKRVQAVKYRLDGKKVRSVRKSAKLKVGKLRAGRHTLTLRVKPRGGKARTLKVRVRTAKR